MSKIILLVVGVIVGYLIGRNHNRVRGLGDGVLGQNSTNAQRAKERQERLQKILDNFGPEDEITNDKVQALLGVSDPTTGRYLEDLEQQGKLRQIGTTGKYVIYRKI